MDSKAAMIRNSDDGPSGPVRRLIARAIRGKDKRPTRFHDQSGQRIRLRAWGNLPMAIASFVCFRIAGHRPEQPWISYMALRHIEGLLRPSWTVLEFGSGMSTPWLAKRCGRVYSIESDKQWFQNTQAALRSQGLKNVELQWREADLYHDLSSFPDAHFDFALVDGIRRADCCRELVRTIKPGGWVYLDNTDRAGANPPSGDLAEAKAILSQAAREHGGACTSFVDFVPTSLVVSEGLLFQL